MASIVLNLYRYNGELVRRAEGTLTVESAKQLVWQYLGDVNHRTILTATVHSQGITVETSLSRYIVRAS